jgi:hypothetical protein
MLQEPVIDCQCDSDEIDLSFPVCLKCGHQTFEYRDDPNDREAVGLACACCGESVVHLRFPDCRHCGEPIITPGELLANEDDNGLCSDCYDEFEDKMDED